MDLFETSQFLFLQARPAINVDDIDTRSKNVLNTSRYTKRDYTCSVMETRTTTRPVGDLETVKNSLLPAMSSSVASSCPVSSARLLCKNLVPQLNLVIFERAIRERFLSASSKASNEITSTSSSVSLGVPLGSSEDVSGSDLDSRIGSG